MKEQNKIVHVLVILIFMLFMTIGGLVTVIKPKETYSYFENRSLQQRPVLEKNGFLEGQYFQDLESYLADHTALRTTLLKIETLVDLHLLKRPVVNDVVVRDDVLLPKLRHTFFDADSLEKEVIEFTGRLAEFDAVVRAYGGTFYYVGVPCQYAYFEDRYPWYLENRADYTATVLSAFTREMVSQGVNFIDMGHIMESMGKPQYFGSLVDNHYGLEGAFSTYKEIVMRINEQTQHELVFPSDEDIVFVDLPNTYIGSRERKLLNLYGFDEPLKVASFKDPIAFTRMDNGLETSPAVYYMPSSEFEPVLYGLYMGGDIAETVIKTNRPELPSVLIYGDSFTNAVEVLAYYSFDEMRTIDLRHYNEMTLAAYVKLYKPDIVIGIRDYEAIILKEGNGNILEN
ncbi:hypothetical protein [Fusibacter tunisiensis]|uniref:AlgX/AlgJ SGNH hydrolase-like domain-containing protein n=1 Tax=Fusibacter tunisiensis TaxID=1008308 RepID=A0ABS2MTI6_9FIRM|nr:hypothetical protein [Fusibacter tunisiensis]MBM7562753.1 hypothetical protein [Fusibacter tunisiensis]